MPWKLTKPELALSLLAEGEREAWDLADALGVKRSRVSCIVSRARSLIKKGKQIECWRDPDWHGIRQYVYAITTDWRDAKPTQQTLKGVA